MRESSPVTGEEREVGTWKPRCDCRRTKFGGAPDDVEGARRTLATDTAGREDASNRPFFPDPGKKARNDSYGDSK